jgi:N utilization substance protein A
MSRELKEALDILEKEKSISKDTLLEAIEQSLIQACKNHFGKADNVHVTINPETCDFSVYADRSIVEYVEDPAMEISLADALKITSRAEIGGMIRSSLRNSDVLRHRMQRTLSCRKSVRKNVKCCMMNTMEKKKK